MASLSEIAKKHGVERKIVEPKEKFGKRRPWLLGDDDISGDISAAADGTKLGPNQDQMGTETGTKPGSNGDQTGSERGARKKETGTKLGAQPGPTSEPNQDQTRTKPGPTKLAFSACVGLQKSILLYLFSSCQGTRSRTSSPISSEHLSISISANVDTTKQATKRLVAKGFIQRSEYKEGRGGWTCYEIAEDVFQDITRHQLLAQLGPNRDQTGTKPGAQPGAQPGPAVSSSSSYELEKENSNTTTTADAFLGSGWDEIDCTPVTSLGLRFGRAQVQQVAKTGAVTPTELRDSILMFAFDLQHNHKRETIVGDPLAFFVGILRRGPYLPPQNYRSPEELQKRAYLEWKRHNTEQCQTLDREIIAIEFDAWWTELSDNARIEYEPKKVGADGFPVGSPFHLQAVREIFVKTIWPSLQAKGQHDLEIRQGANAGERNAP